MILITNILIIIIFTAVFLISVNYDKNYIKNLSKKEHPLIGMYSLCSYIFYKVKILNSFIKNPKIQKKLKKLYIEKKEDIFKEYLLKKMSVVILVFLIFNIFSIVLSISDNCNGELLDNKYIRRPVPGQGSKNINLDIMFENEGNIYEENINIDVNEQRLNLKQEKKLIEECTEYIDKKFLGKNQSLDSIKDNVVLVENIPNTGITVEWVLDTQGLIDRKGNVNNGDISKGGILSSVKAIIKYFEHETEHTIFFKVVPPELSYKEKIIKKLKEKVLEEEKSSLSNKLLELPKEIYGTKILYKSIVARRGIKIFIFGSIISVFIFILWDRSLDDKMKKRKNQMLIDYPEIINKFMLLTEAGMNAKNAWGKIVTEYKNNFDFKSKNIRFAYEEMLVTWNEMANGKSEEEAYEEFGKRINILSYIKFGSLLSQNVRKGSKGLSTQLEFEVYEAFEERKETAKRLGEEAGTKLLGPMMIMLIIVFMIIIIPAFLSF